MLLKTRRIEWADSATQQASEVWLYHMIDILKIPGHK